MTVQRAKALIRDVRILEPQESKFLQGGDTVERLVRKPGPAQHKHLQIRQFLQVFDRRVRDSCFGEIQVLESLEVRNMGDSRVGYLRSIKVQRDKALDFSEMNQPVVFNIGACKQKSLKLREVG